MTVRRIEHKVTSLIAALLITITGLGFATSVASAQTNVTAHAATKQVCVTLNWNASQSKNNAGWSLQNQAMSFDVSGDRIHLSWSAISDWTIKSQNVHILLDGNVPEVIPPGTWNSLGTSHDTGPRFKSSSITACHTVSTVASPLVLTASVLKATANQQVTFTATVSPHASGRVVYLQFMGQAASRWTSFIRSTTNTAGRAVFKRTFGVSNTTILVRTVVIKTGKYPRAISSVLTMTLK
jgi:hypothetical protein